MPSAACIEDMRYFCPIVWLQIHHVARRAAMVAQCQAALIAGLVVEQQNAALAGRERLRPMEAECAEGPEGARRTALIGRACGLGGVLD